MTKAMRKAASEAIAQRAKTRAAGSGTNDRRRPALRHYVPSQRASMSVGLCQPPKHIQRPRAAAANGVRSRKGVSYPRLGAL
jgi:hypothetical protein